MRPTRRSHRPFERMGSGQLPPFGYFVLFGLSSRRDCRVSPPREKLAHAGLVSVALVRTFHLAIKMKWMGITHYAALRSPDFPPPPKSGRERSPERILSKNKKAYGVATACFSAGSEAAPEGSVGDGAAPSNSFNWVLAKLAHTRSGYFCTIC